MISLLVIADQEEGLLLFLIQYIFGRQSAGISLQLQKLMLIRRANKLVVLKVKLATTPAFS